MLQYAGPSGANASNGLKTTRQLTAMSLSAQARAVPSIFGLLSSRVLGVQAKVLKAQAALPSAARAHTSHPHPLFEGQRPEERNKGLVLK